MTVADAALASVQAGLAPVPVYDGHVPDSPPERYAVLYPDAGTVAAQALDGVSDLGTFRFRLTYVTRGGQAGRRGVEFLARKARAALVDQTLDVPDWALGPVLHESTEPVRRDEDEPSALVLFASDGFVTYGARA